MAKKYPHSYRLCGFFVFAEMNNLIIDNSEFRIWNLLKFRVSFSNVNLIFLKLTIRPVGDIILSAIL